MKKLQNGVFSSISDAELILNNIKKEPTLEEQPAVTQSQDVYDMPEE